MLSGDTSLTYTLVYLAALFNLQRLSHDNCSRATFNSVYTSIGLILLNIGSHWALTCMCGSLASIFRCLIRFPSTKLSIKFQSYLLSPRLTTKTEGNTSATDDLYPSSLDDVDEVIDTQDDPLSPLSSRLPGKRPL